MRRSGVRLEAIPDRMDRGVNPRLSPLSVAENRGPTLPSSPQDHTGVALSAVSCLSQMTFCINRANRCSSGYPLPFVRPMFARHGAELVSVVPGSRRAHPERARAKKAAAHRTRPPRASPHHYLYCILVAGSPRRIHVRRMSRLLTARLAAATASPSVNDWPP